MSDQSLFCIAKNIRELIFYLLDTTVEGNLRMSIKTEFNLAISLGMNCQSRFHISRVMWERSGNSPESFALPSKDGNTFDYGSFFFDWTWMNGLEGVISLLKSRFQNSFDRDDFELRTIDSEYEAFNSRYGLFFTHAFHLGSNPHASFCEQFEAVKEKYTYLAEKTVSSMSKRNSILFVLCGPIDRGEFASLFAVIHDTYQIDQPMFLLCPFSNGPYKSSISFDNDHVLIRPIDWERWPGSTTSWNNAFAGLTFQR